MSELNDWFLSLPEARQAGLRDDKWFLAEVAFAAGKAARAQPAQAGQEPITSETGNTPDQGASAITSESGKAGQVLTDDEIDREWQFGHDEEGNPPNHDDFARAIEAAVLAKRVPMTPKTLTLEQCVTFAKLVGIKLSPAQFSGVLEAEVSEFDLQTFANLCVGIVGEKGGA